MTSKKSSTPDIVEPGKKTTEKEKVVLETFGPTECEQGQCDPEETSPKTKTIVTQNGEHSTIEKEIDENGNVLSVTYSCGVASKDPTEAFDQLDFSTDIGENRVTNFSINKKFFQDVSYTDSAKILSAKIASPEQEEIQLNLALNYSMENGAFSLKGTIKGKTKANNEGIQYKIDKSIDYTQEHCDVEVTEEYDGNKIQVDFDCNLDDSLEGFWIFDNPNVPNTRDNQVWSAPIDW